MRSIAGKMAKAIRSTMWPRTRLTSSSPSNRHRAAPATYSDAVVVLGHVPCFRSRPSTFWISSGCPGARRPRRGTGGRLDRSFPGAPAAEHTRPSSRSIQRSGRSCPGTDPRRGVANGRPARTVCTWPSAPKTASRRSRQAVARALTERRIVAGDRRGGDVGWDSRRRSTWGVRGGRRDVGNPLPVVRHAGTTGRCPHQNATHVNTRDRNSMDVFGTGPILARCRSDCSPDRPVPRDREAVVPTRPGRAHHRADPTACSTFPAHRCSTMWHGGAPVGAVAAAATSTGVPAVPVEALPCCC